MTFIRQNIGPLLIVLVFLFALVTMSARIFLPTDLSGPAPLTGLISNFAGLTITVADGKPFSN
jgi:hypothetical protein